MSSRETTAASTAAPAPGTVSSAEAVEARRHIAAVAEIHRAARGTAEFVSAPHTRRFGRRMSLAGVGIADTVRRVWRRTKDANKLPGRWFRRLLLIRPSQTLSVWAVVWFTLAAACGAVLFFTGDKKIDVGVAGFNAVLDWFAAWAFAGAVAALVSVLWHDGIKSPYTARRVRRRIIADPEALLRPTLAKQAAKVRELDPPVNTVPRDELYDELLPGALARKKDVQIVVGVPGAGKTTALIDLASLLAKIGLVPILLPLRGETTSDELYDRARKRFEEQVRPLVGAGNDADVVWRWLCRRQRVAILADDFDQIGFDGEPGFMMRHLIEAVAAERQAVIVTVRPAGVPVGIAASAIFMKPLALETAIDLAARPALREPGATTSDKSPRRQIQRWVEAGELNESPLYLEALAELTSVGSCPDLPDDPGRWASTARPGRARRLSDHRRVWNPLWVRYMLLDLFRARVLDGTVRPSLAIDRPDRERSLRALERAALGMLGATGLEARAAAHHGDEPLETRTGQPKRSRLVDFISTDDRQSFDYKRVDAKVVRRRRDVSQHEAIDTGERLRILEPDWHGDPQFRHRIMQAFLAGRCLAEFGRREREGKNRLGAGNGRPDGPVESFDDWVDTLMDHHHPEKLSAHLALTFAAIHADDRGVHDAEGHWDGLAQTIAERLVGKAEERGSALGVGVMSALGAAQVTTVVPGHDGGAEVDLVKLLDPMEAPDPHDREDPDDNLIKLTTAANIVALLKPAGHFPELERLRDRTILHVTANENAMRWTKLEGLPAIASLDTAGSWLAIWRNFAHDLDYDIRRAASQHLERNACRAYPDLRREVEREILRAGSRAANGLPLQSVEAGDTGWDEQSMRAFTALGWVLPAIVSGLSEELRIETGVDPDEVARADGASSQDGHGLSEACLRDARSQLEAFVTLAYEGDRHELEESLAQGFKADAMRHASSPAKGITGPGWVASNRRLVADVALPHAESWYARMLLYQALALYAIAGTGREDTLDMLAHRLHPTRERHPLARQAARLARSAVRRAELGAQSWNGFIWSDDVEDGGRLPTTLGRKAAQLVGDVAVLVDLKDGSPEDRHVNFGHMEELPYCLSGSPDRYEILGKGCPKHCGWGFCPYRAASPDEPNEHRGLSRVFCRGERRFASSGSPFRRQRGIRRRRMRDFWEQMEYKARK